MKKEVYLMIQFITLIFITNSVWNRLAHAQPLNISLPSSNPFRNKLFNLDENIPLAFSESHDKNKFIYHDEKTRIKISDYKAHDIVKHSEVFNTYDQRDNYQERITGLRRNNKIPLDAGLTDDSTAELSNHRITKRSEDTANTPELTGKGKTVATEAGVNGNNNISPTTNTAATSTNSSSLENKEDNGDRVMPNKTFTTAALRRGFYVFLGCNAIVVLYLGIKFACQRRRSRYKKVARGEEIDMYPLTVSEEEEDDDEIFSADMRR